MVVSLPMIILVSIAAFLMFRGTPGWRWLIFIAILNSPILKQDNHVTVTKTQDRLNNESTN